MNTQSPDLIKAIIFDLGNVIVLFDHFTICRNLSAYSPYSPEEIYNMLFTSGLESLFDTGKISPEDFFKEASGALQLTIDIEQFKEIWCNIFSLNPGIDNLIVKLKKKYQLFCLSNTNMWQFEHCRKHFTILDNFDSFILSFQEGVKKPDWKIYEKALQEADAVPEECIYIDDVKKFVQAAEEKGMKAIRFTSTEDLVSALRGYLS
jgi:epoxide hydrolase-like predicted phosphatase